MGLTKCIIRIGVIGGLAAGAAALIAGPERLHALGSQMRQHVNARIDKNISDPVALRAQLSRLASQYPQRVAAVEADLEELEGNLAQMTEDYATKAIQVEFIAADLNDVNAAIARVEQSSNIERTSYGAAAARKYEFKGEIVTASQLRDDRDALIRTHNQTVARANDLRRDIEAFEQQRTRLAALHTKLTDEQRQFEEQLADLDRQVDAIARNERMIEIIERREQRITQLSRYESQSLDHIKSKLANLRAEQNSKLITLSRSQSRESYEQRAKMEYNRRNAGVESAPVLKPLAQLEGPTEIIDVTPDGGDESDDDDESAGVVFNID